MTGAPDKLDTLADWFDAEEKRTGRWPQAADGVPAVAEDLRAWAAEIRADSQDARFRRMKVAENEADSLRGALKFLMKCLDDLVSDSDGVAGLHRNGEIALWSDLLDDGYMSEWLADSVSAARQALSDPNTTNQGG